MMSSFAPLLLVLISSLAWALLDLVRKGLAGRLPAMPLLLLTTALPTPLFLAWWMLEGSAPPAAGYFLPGLLSIAINVLANALFLRAMAVSPLSITIPLLALTPMFSSLLAIPLLRELPTAVQSLGILLVVGGALVLNLRSGDGASPADFWRAFRREPGAAMMAGVALLWSVTPALDKLAMAEASPSFHAFMLNAGVALAAAVWLAAQGQLHAVRGGTRVVGLLLAGVACSVTGLSTQLVAMQSIHVGLLETIKRGIGFAGAVLLGRWVFQEPIGLAKIVAVAMMAVGVAAILL
jgi:drug/metabolite transporter (DMT)-like permease